MQRALPRAFVAVLVGLVGTVCQAATIHVPADYHQIQGAINAALTGDVIIVSPGTYAPIQFLGKSVTVRSTNPADWNVVASTVIDGHGATVSGADFSNSESSGAILDGLKIINCAGTTNNGIWGGGIFCKYSTPIVRHCLITKNSATSGGGVYGYMAAPTLQDDRIINNAAGAGAGAMIQGGSATITDCFFSANHGADCVGLYFLGSDGTVSRCEFVGNTSSAALGAGIACGGGTQTISNCTVAGNSGNGVRIFDAAVTLDSSIIASSKGAAGYGILVGSGAAPTVRYSDVWHNAAGNYSGMTSATGKSGNLSMDPLFVDPTNNVYRLKSTGGHWNDSLSSWSADTVTSPGVDGGNPALDYSQEPTPNGGRVNMGYDGNTSHASKSAPPVVTHWTPTGTGVPRSTTITMRFSALMKHASVQNSLYLNGTKVTTGMWEWVGKEATYIPVPTLLANQLYNVKLGKAAQSLSGQPMAADFTWHFTTGGSALGSVTVAAAPSGCGAQLSLHLAAAATVTVRIANVAGHEVAVLQPGQLGAGMQTLLWNGRSAGGTRVPVGTYLVTVTAAAADGMQASAVATLRVGSGN